MERDPFNEIEAYIQMVKYSTSTVDFIIPLIADMLGITYFLLLVCFRCGNTN